MPEARDGLLADAVAGFERGFLHRQREADGARPAEQPRKPDEIGLTASDFLQLVVDCQG